ncbi:MAG: response regulator transcription factor [Lachnospiraceae bacterium]|nr:response regulator transcription factor [Lachnospiraceae bacterium]MDD6666914.1 response regulator transcription factor [Lachnospiraceae bacterium]
MYKIFIVEDEKSIVSGITELVKKWGMEAKSAKDLSQVTKEFLDYAPHLVLMDISLPFYNGYYWCSEIRKVSKVPILFLSAMSDNMNMVMAMNMGADDFIAKPFDDQILMAKINAILRRTYDFSDSVHVIEHRGAILNTGDQSLIYKGRTIELTKNEYRILLTLMENRERVVSREKLIEQIWKTENFIDENTLTVNINRLRKKLDQAGLEGFIETKFGEGYIVK